VQKILLDSIDQEYKEISQFLKIQLKINKRFKKKLHKSEIGQEVHENVFNITDWGTTIQL
jgi:hypothetical protein